MANMGRQRLVAGDIKICSAHDLVLHDAVARLHVPKDANVGTKVGHVSASCVSGCHIQKRESFRRSQTIINQKERAGGQKIILHDRRPLPKVRESVTMEREWVGCVVFLLSFIC